MDPNLENEISDVRAELVQPLTQFDESRDCWEIPLCANSWLVRPGEHAVITSCGLGNWLESDVVTRVFFRVKETVKLELALRCKVAPEGDSLVEVRVLGVPQLLKLQGAQYHAVPVGRFRIFGSGYVQVDLKGVEKTGDYFADVSHLLVARKDLPQDAICYIKGEDREETYWHRRGPSLHLTYKVPPGCGDQEYYYNEVTVPRGFDKVGSYFMAIGFDGGYFGIQVNGPDERRVLFSVWSPQDTDNPEDITEDNAVLVINKGEHVHVEAFGIEGAGGKSYLLYDWSPEVTYKFLVRGRPDPMTADCTVFSAWFGDRSRPDWRLIAEFVRPKTSTYLTSFYSFIENFEQHESSSCRKCYFNNQWIQDTSGRWYEVTEARITGDGTAEGRVRLDFEGGVANDEDACRGFYLKHCGFFVGACNLASVIARPASNAAAPCTQYRHRKDQLVLERKVRAELVDSDRDGSVADSEMYEVSLRANGWLVGDDASTVAVITEYGVGNWMSLDTRINVYFFVRKPVKLDLFLRCKVPSGRSEIEVDVCGATKSVTIEGGDYHNVFVGRYRFLGRDYAKIVLRGVAMEGAFIADVSHILTPQDELAADSIACIEVGEGLQEARKGPSVFLNYEVADEDIPDEFYYVEVNVDRQDCRLGSKIVAIGFDGGYVGIQDGKKVVFAVVADEGDDSEEGPEEATACLISEEEDVATDYVRRDGRLEVASSAEMRWPDDDGSTTRCRFLVHGRPDHEKPGYALYRAWCNHRDCGDSWRLISELRNRNANGCLSGFHSAVSNSNPDNGHLLIKSTFCDQLVRKGTEEVLQITRADVKVEANKARTDYDVSVVNTEDGREGFLIRTCGFLNGDPVDGTTISKKTDECPEVDFHHFI